MVKMGGAYYVLGGTNGTKVLRSVESWNEEGNWNMITPMNKARMNFAATVLDDKIYVFGGINKMKQATSTIERYSDGVW